MELIFPLLFLFLIGGGFFFIYRKFNPNQLMDRFSKDFRDSFSQEMRQQREELQQSQLHLKQELNQQIQQQQQSLKDQLEVFSKQFHRLTNMNEEKLENLRRVVDERLFDIQKDNEKQLNQMRLTVDEKLHATLEKRLGDSFKIVSERLEKVHQGLGEMQNLATGVGDLKRILTNVKTRGTWGEIQLQNLLEQVLTPEQYEANVVTKKGSRDPVEFAIVLPGRDEHQKVYLPIDAKFPREDYERLLLAQEQSDKEGVEQAKKGLEVRLKGEAKKIKEKYIDPPNTTDFGILFLPTEGLYAEVLQQVGLNEFIQREYRVMIAGPTTLAALLNSLQLGFRTLAVEKRASEVWVLLGKVKTEFGKFGDLLDKTQKKLMEASNTIEKAASKSRNIESKLKRVEIESSTDEKQEESYDIFLQ